MRFEVMRSLRFKVIRGKVFLESLRSETYGAFNPAWSLKP